MNKEQNHQRREGNRGGRPPRGGRPHRGGDRDRGNDRGNFRGPRGGDDRGGRDRDRGYGRPQGGYRDREREDRFRRDDRREGDDEPRRRGEPGMEFTGRSVEDALEEASRRLGVGRDQMKVQVVEEGSKGFLGILGSKPAVVRIQLGAEAAHAYAETALNKILKEMGLPDKVKRRRDGDGNTVLDIQGPSGGVLIGRHGQTLESLQYIILKMLQRVTSDERAMVIVDVESYRERQNDKLRELAQSLAAKAKDSGEEVSLRPMSARDRRTVHMTLKDDSEVTTQSRGEGLRRRVVIIPKNPKAPATSPEPGNEAPEVPPSSEEDPQPGNQAPAEPLVDDNIGNR